MFQVLYSCFVKNGQYRIVADMAAVINIGDAHGNFSRESKVSGKFDFHSCHNSVCSKDREVKSVAVIVQRVDEVENIHEIIR